MKTGKDLTFEEIAVLEKQTGGKIGTHEWWVVKGSDGSFTSRTKPSHEEDILYHGVLENSFLTQYNEYIGDVERAKWYAKHRLKVYQSFPHGVAEAYNETGELEGYCGYTHRGANIFRIGDRLFDQSYEPKEEDYTPEQWAEWVKEYNDGIAKAEAEGDTWWAEDIKSDGIGRFIPYKLRGADVCKTFECCAQAAINLSNYLS
jgi:hypothetical protein